MKKNDGNEKWRSNELKSLSGFVQNKIYQLQNPDYCNRARKLNCDINKVNSK